MPRTVDLGDLALNPHEATSGIDVLRGFLDLASSAIMRLSDAGMTRPALSGRLRGTGRGVSLRRMIELLEQEHPLRLASPFEGSHLVSGAVWEARQLLTSTDDRGLAKLRWEAGADDLPMHVHEHADRFIVVLEGRGFFHVSDQTLEEFDGSSVTTTAARERDVFLFTRGVMHTFSTHEHAMTLLSVQLPHIPFEDERQFAFPKKNWIPRQHESGRVGSIKVGGWIVQAR